MPLARMWVRQAELPRGIIEFDRRLTSPFLCMQSLPVAPHLSQARYGMRFSIQNAFKGEVQSSLSYHPIFRSPDS